jgi:hypothetical protein
VVGLGSMGLGGGVSGFSSGCIGCLGSDTFRRRGRVFIRPRPRSRRGNAGSRLDLVELDSAIRHHRGRRQPRSRRRRLCHHWQAHIGHRDGSEPEPKPPRRNTCQWPRDRSRSLEEDVVARRQAGRGGTTGVGDDSERFDGTRRVAAAPNAGCGTRDAEGGRRGSSREVLRARCRCGCCGVLGATVPLVLSFSVLGFFWVSRLRCKPCLRFGLGFIRASFWAFHRCPASLSLAILTPHASFDQLHPPSSHTSFLGVHRPLTTSFGLQACDGDVSAWTFGFLGSRGSA